MSIIIGADFVPTDTNKELFVQGDVEALIGKELMEILKKAEYRIFNLEVPLSDVESPIEKCGPNLIASKNTINAYKAMGTDILTLANNHILDQGQQGLKSTCEILKENNIAYLGAGDNVHEAAKPYIFTYEGKKIGIYACAEHEFSIASDCMGGANPFEPLDSPDHVADLKKQCDFVIVLYHGGKEHYRYPSPNLQKTCRKLVQKGADLVVCQHSHCIGCEEKFENGVIIYGQGNFIFDHSDSEYWQTSLLIQIDSELEVSYIPIIKNKNTIRLAQNMDAEKVMKEFHARSSEILTSGFVEAEYKKYADSMLQHYLLRLLGKRSIVMRILNRLTGSRLNNWIINKKYGNPNKLGIQNIIECEAHRELLLFALKNN